MTDFARRVDRFQRVMIACTATAAVTVATVLVCRVVLHTDLGLALSIAGVVLPVIGLPLGIYAAYVPRRGSDGHLLPVAEEISVGRRRRTVLTAFVAVAGVTLCTVGVRVSTSGPGSPFEELYDLLPNELIGENLDGPLDVLVVVPSEHWREGEPMYADSIVIFHIPAAHDQTYAISLSSDFLVSIPAFPASNYAGAAQAKLGDVLAAGGGPLLTEVLSNLASNRLAFNAAVAITVEGLEKLVSAMGGIDKMCVDERVLSENYDNRGTRVDETGGDPNVAKIYPVGCYSMMPWEAMDFVRQRKYLATGDGDLGRKRHQQKLLVTVVKQLVSDGFFRDSTKSIAIQNALGGSVTVDLGEWDPIDWLFTLKGIGPSDITSVMTDGGNTNVITVDKVSFVQVTPDTRALLEAMSNDTVFDFLTGHPTWITAP